MTKMFSSETWRAIPDFLAWREPIAHVHRVVYLCRSGGRATCKAHTRGSRQRHLQTECCAPWVTVICVGQWGWNLDSPSALAGVLCASCLMQGFDGWGLGETPFDLGTDLGWSPLTRANWKLSGKQDGFILWLGSCVVSSLKVGSTQICCFLIAKIV